MLIAQISDTHIDPDGVKGAERLRDLERCVDHINRLDPLPDVVIHTGDLAHDGDTAKYRAAMHVLGAFRSPLLVAAGNRDDRAAIRACFAVGRDLLPGTPFVQYSIDDYPVRLIALDTLSETSNMGAFCDVRADALRAALAEDGKRPTALFMHHPAFEVRESDYRWQFESSSGIDRMRRALAGQDHVVRAFCGHAHRSAAGKIAEVLATSTPCVAVDLRLGAYPEELRAVPLYQLHRFDARQGFVSELRAAL